MRLNCWPAVRRPNLICSRSGDESNGDHKKCVEENRVWHAPLRTARTHVALGTCEQSNSNSCRDLRAPNTADLQRQASQQERLYQRNSRRTLNSRMFSESSKGVVTNGKTTPFPKRPKASGRATRPHHRGGMPLLADCGQALGEIGLEVGGVFQADGESDEAVADAVCGSLGGGHEFVGGSRRVRDC